MSLGKGLQVVVNVQDEVKQRLHAPTVEPTGHSANLFCWLAEIDRHEKRLPRVAKRGHSCLVSAKPSHQVIRSALERGHIKEIAETMGISLSLLYKWGEAQPAGSNSSNPLERISQLYELTGDEALLQWLCHKADGCFVRNPATGQHLEREVMPATQQIVQQFAGLLAEISSAALDNRISSEEAANIRAQWDELKRVTERFVKFCEQGELSELKKSTQAS